MATFRPQDQQFLIEIDILPDTIIEQNERFNVSIDLPPTEPLRSRINIERPSNVTVMMCGESPRSESCSVTAQPCANEFEQIQCNPLQFTGPVTYR